MRIYFILRKARYAITKGRALVGVQEAMSPEVIAILHLIVPSIKPKRHSVPVYCIQSHSKNSLIAPNAEAYAEKVDLLHTVSYV